MDIIEDFRGFQLYFAGIQNKLAEQKLKDNNNCRLMSWANDKKHLQNWFDEGRRVFVDSGAFTAHTKGITLDIDEYIRYCNEHDDTIRVLAEMDHIPGRFGQPKTKEQLAEGPEISWQNYLYMRERLKSPDKCLPILHQGEDLKHLERMLETTFDGKHIPYIGISPSNEVSPVTKDLWLGKVFKIIKNSSNPHVKTHAFGMTTLRILEKYPIYSADSTSWIMASANGFIFSKHGTLIVSENQKSSPKHVRHLPKPVLEELIGQIQAWGYTLDQLETDYKARSMWNIDYLTDWARNYKYKPQTTTQNTLF